jgi:hypothetical protein
MPDIAEGRTAVREAMRRAEEAAGIYRDASGNETYDAPEATPVTLPELEGAVPVAASDQPLPVEPVAEAATPAEEATQEPQEPETPEPPASLGVEELQAEVTRLQEQLANKDSFIGRQSTDVGELRAELEALRAQVTTATTPQPVAPPQLIITQQLIEEDPAKATMLAFEQNNGQALAVAFEAWKEEDPFTAASWRADRLIEKQQADFQKELQAVRGEVEQVKAPQAAAAERNAWSDAFLEMQKSYPDFLEADDAGRTNAQRLLEEVAPKFPTIAKLIADGDVAAKVEGLTLLYDKGKLGDPAGVAAELQTAAEEAAASAAAARTAAATVNGQSSAGQGSTVELTEEEAEAKRYIDRMSGKASLERGWTGRKEA